MNKLLSIQYTTNTFILGLYQFESRIPNSIKLSINDILNKSDSIPCSVMIILSTLKFMNYNRIVNYIKFTNLEFFLEL